MAVLAALAASVVVTALVGRWVLQQRLDERIDRDLVSEVDEFQRLIREGDPQTGEPFDSDVEAAFDEFFASNVPDADGVFIGLIGDRPYLRSADPRYPVEQLGDLVHLWSTSASATFGVAGTPAGSLRYLVSPVNDPEGVVVGTLVVGRFPGDERSEVDAAAWTVAAVGLVVIVLGGAVGWALAVRRSGASDVPVPSEEHEELDLTPLPAGEVADVPTPSPRAFLEDAERELRAPVTVLRAHLANADLRRPLEPASRDVVLAELDRMDNIVADLALIAEAGRPGFLHPEPVDISELTEEVARRAQTLGERAWDVRVGTLVNARLDRARIVQAWMHLLRNAVAHTWRSDRITVFSDVSGSSLELGVVDSGQGMGEEEIEQLFAPFRRGSETARTSTDGGGLGLTVVRAVAEAHGGRVEVRDTPGGGATVLLSVPLERTGPLDQGPRWETSET